MYKAACLFVGSSKCGWIPHEIPTPVDLDLRILTSVSASFCTFWYWSKVPGLSYTYTAGFWV
jgi:hypothetical protein